MVEHIAALDRNRFDIHVACTNVVPHLVEQFKAAGARVHLMDMPRLRGASARNILGFAGSIRGLRAIIRDFHIDLVVSNTTRASYIASMAVLSTRTPLVWWVRDYFYPRSIFRLTRWIPARVVYVAHALRRFYGDGAAPTALVWPVGSDLYLELQTITAHDVQAARASYGFTPADVVCGFMGRLVEEKGAADVIAAVAALAPEFPRLRLLVVGTGAGQKNNSEAALHQLVHDRGLSSTIRFAGFQTTQALHYSLFDLFVMATRDYEAYPTSVVQAMMAGKPVIASDVGGNPEIVHHERTGLLYPPGNVTELTNAMRRLLNDSPLSNRLSEAGRDQVMANNRGAPLARTAEAVYDSLARR